MSITDVKSFLELASYYRHFLAGFANIAAPLHEYTKKTTTFAQAAFTKLKIVFIEAPVLVYPDPSYPFLLDTDADALSRCPPALTLVANIAVKETPQKSYTWQLIHL